MFDPLTDKTVYNYRDFDFTPNVSAPPKLMYGRPFPAQHCP